MTAIIENTIPGHDPCSPQHSIPWLISCLTAIIEWSSPGLGPVCQIKISCVFSAMMYFMFVRYNWTQFQGATPVRQSIIYFVCSIPWCISCLSDIIDTQFQGTIPVRQIIIYLCSIPWCTSCLSEIIDTQFQGAIPVCQNTIIYLCVQFHDVIHVCQI